MIITLGIILFFIISFLIVYEIRKERPKELLSTIQRRSNLPIINIKKTSCFGYCPVYDAAIFPDGTVAYDGQENVKHVGYFEFKITQNEINDIRKSIDSLNVFALSDEYDENITDIPSTILTFYQNDKAKRIKVRYGAPQKLNEFINKVHAIVNQKNEI